MQVPQGNQQPQPQQQQGIPQAANGGASAAGAGAQGGHPLFGLGQQTHLVCRPSCLGASTCIVARSNSKSGTNFGTGSVSSDTHGLGAKQSASIAPDGSSGHWRQSLPVPVPLLQLQCTCYAVSKCKVWTDQTNPACLVPNMLVLKLHVQLTYHYYCQINGSISYR